MEKFSKKDLVLRETTYKKKNVKLKESQLNSIENEIGTNGGDVTLNGSNGQLYTPNAVSTDIVVPQSLSNSQISNIAGQAAVNATNGKPNPVDVNVTKVKDNALPPEQKQKISQQANQTPSSTNSTLEEGVIFSKREMNQFLKSL